jgi:restriction system protein
MNKAIVVTSGHFSSDAIQYAEDVGIELVDINKLKDLAKQIGLTLHDESKLLVDNCFPISDQSVIVDNFYRFLEDDLENFDKSLVKIEEIGVQFQSTYMIDYAVHASFSTSAGVHSIDASSSAFFSGEDGQLWKPEFTDVFMPLKNQLSEMHEEEMKVRLLKKGEFLKSFKDIKENAKETLRMLHAKNVSYYGRNGVRYNKRCIPKKKDISIQDAKRVYMPIWNIVFSILMNKYLMVATETSGTLNIFPTSSFTLSATSILKAYPDHCMICERELREAYVCEECGAIVCSSDKFYCRVCGKVVCRNDLVSNRRYLIFMDRYCAKCATSLGIELKPQN